MEEGSVLHGSQSAKPVPLQHTVNTTMSKQEIKIMVNSLCIIRYSLIVYIGILI